MKKVLVAMSLAVLSATSMAAVVTESGEQVKNAYGEVWQTPDSDK